MNLADQQALDDITAPQQWDLHDDELFADIAGSAKVGEAVRQLLLQRELIKKTQASFGADKSRVCDALLPMLDQLHQACVDQFREIL